ncbi:M16 family metallopeptidase [Galenea microaerophila]
MKQLKIFLLMGLSLFWMTAQAAPLQIQSWHTTKGAKVMYVYAPGIPMVDLQISFDAGSARDGQQWGVANMTAAMLSAGTSHHSENAISDTFNRYGAVYGQAVERDMATFSLRTLTRKENYQASVQLFSEILGFPSFPQDVFQREQSNLLEALKQKKTKPSAIASETFWQALYGDHPYAHPVSGTEQTVKTLTPKALKRFYQRYYTAKNATLAIVGDVNLSQAKQLAEKVTQYLPKGVQPAPLPPVKAVTQAQTLVKSFPSSQTYYYLGQEGVKRGDPDYYALFLGNHLLGGAGFASMLMQTVREDRGLVYSVYSYFVPMKQPGPFIIGLSTKNASAKAADQVVQETLKAFLQGQFTEAKLQAIKDNLIGGFPLRFDSNRKIVGYLSMIGFYNLPTDYLHTFPQKIASLTKADVLAACRKHIHPERMIKVMVGQPK